MLKRTLTGAGFVAVIVGFFLLREYVGAQWFLLLVGLLIVLGSFEMLRALHGKLSAAETAASAAFAAAFLPVWRFFGRLGAFCEATALVLALLVILIFDKKASLEGTGAALLAALYPALPLGCMAETNDLPAALPALVLIFVISPAADTFAYLVGRALKGPKLIPSVSPNKTVSGAIGGLVGGSAGAVAVYFIFRGYGIERPLGWLIFLAIGLVGSALTELGDLAESAIKRKLGIKDMGKLLPGHGGILDRIDGILYASAFVYAAFGVLFV